ncbi:hypothetical protein [Jiangella muralis]|uniref:hypothetical protein n=1 Tax=Jiangella muralis TaxID=702383 RepID=UPI00069EDE16|nr:hypothetical protein [Jiangella muralis]
MTSDTENVTFSDLGRFAAGKRHHPRTYARSILRRWPDLSADEQTEIRAILAPVVVRDDSDEAADEA